MKEIAVILMLAVALLMEIDLLFEIRTAKKSLKDFLNKEGYELEDFMQRRRDCDQNDFNLCYFRKRRKL